MKKKILVADDDDGVVELLQSAFENAGYDVVCSQTGFKLLDLVVRERPDLIILDVMMPGMDGYSFQLKLDENESTSMMPVIIITALPAARSLFEKFPQVKLFLNKPFDTAELLSKVKELCGGN